ncbi:SAM-dependent methyltransferase [Alteromonas flava]|uniref:SAM-dependent methyltransferase n=1 Tax=Alteromonas flava TaxID=2048003 RepID=UPI000C285D2F|nr:SAM-dependent methyltransferase [Alteromonas flava]
MDAKIQGSLVVVGTGISVSGQMTAIAQNQIRAADEVYVAIPNKPGIEYIRQLNPSLHLLTDFYAEGKSRIQTYQQMVDVLIAAVSQGKRVCAAFYGHPGVFVNPSHRVIQLLRERGFAAHMEPGISAEDCLVADLGIDPAEYGCQSYEATQFLFRKYAIDPHMTQIIWQIWGVGDHTFTSKLAHTTDGLKLLTEKLKRYYPAEQRVIIYEAKTSPIFVSRIAEVTLKELPDATLSAVSTLVIPGNSLPDFDHDALDALGLTEDDILSHLDSPGSPTTLAK